MINIEQFLKDGAAELGVELSDEKIALMMGIMSAVLEKNAVMNLTSVTDEREFVVKHLLDSLSLAAFMGVHGDGAGFTFVDVGTGAGFPGLPLAVVFPRMKFTLLDATKKKLAFIDETAKKLGLANVETFWARAEDAGRNTRLRQTFDFCAARAVANLPVLTELCLPFLKHGGRCLLMKGPETDEKEILVLKHAALFMGGSVERVKRFNLLDDYAERAVIIIRKFRHTPPKYPRTYDEMLKTPLYKP